MPTTRTEGGAAQVVLACPDLAASQAFFTERLGLRLVRIAPADDPREALLVGRGLRLLLRRGQASPSPARLQVESDDPALLGADPGAWIAPCGTRVEWTPATRCLQVPELEPGLVVSRAAGDWVTGRAGMLYRDLLPGRLGGRFGASRIRIPRGGPVPDAVHYHTVRFQLIHCVAGWVRLVYEDQGPPFVLAAGDAVLQPPGIRHRVLESSDGLEVVELACPAEHDTHLDGRLQLPTVTLRPEREFGGQRFHLQRGQQAAWREVESGLEGQDLGFGPATGGLAEVRVLRARAGTSTAMEPAAELQFLTLLLGALTLRGPGGQELALENGDSAALPPGGPWQVAAVDKAASWLEVRLPAGRDFT